MGAHAFCASNRVDGLPWPILVRTMSRRQSISTCLEIPCESFLAEQPELAFDKELKLVLTPKEMKGEQFGYQGTKANQSAKFVVGGKVWQGRVTASCSGECPTS